ncbi:DEAD/DEAH box helicase [Sphingomonas sp. LY29]|uniref:DEAD/DEAH box helicase n=1 Tax=unclassified Sphingomonas TaxID=196159 RepID=UPI002ADEBC9B|nr:MULTISPECIES: DEAD/DEAH box helicase [unclassified Sphingomonas]MEA1071045.1 DEAD/DEAH box helicase [Sphingomonas sp. LY160]WRP26219.1 DEAD/DEAH box helicase [Sphingomonas sp. LY29]
MSHPQIPPTLARALDARGYETLTEVQSAAVAPEAADRDLIVSARTGSGKTVAFGLAMAHQMLEGDKMPWARVPLGLIIAPTRELALQVSKELEWLYADAGARVVNCVGGMDPMKERRALAGGAHIVVGTPGRLRDHLERGALDLSGLRVAVLDEADEMLDMGFREELEEILDATPAERRTLLFSATMPRPIVALARRYQKDALRIETLGDNKGHGDIAYQAVAVSPPDIEHAVVNLLRFHEAETAILFCATRDAVRRLHASLIERGFHAVALSGEHSQSERNHALQALRDQRARVCVATDVAARGIDLPSVSLVIHVELPRDAEALQHRSGRTGRAGRKGTAILVVPFPARRRVEGMLRGARIEAEWITPPTPSQIAERDRARLMEGLNAPAEPDEEALELAGRLMAEMTPDAIALALAKSLRASMPAPEDIIEQADRPAGPGQHAQRAGFDGSTWFRMNAGRRHRADPRWLLPLICRYGHVNRNDIGAIRIAADESYFEVSARAAPGFVKALKRAQFPDADGLVIEPSGGRPPPPAPGPRRKGPPPRR